MSNSFQGISAEQAQAILPVLEVIRQQSLNDGERMLNMYRQLEQENKRLREENEMLKDEVAEFRYAAAVFVKAATQF